MHMMQTLYGVIIFLVFWAFQAGYFASLGTASWFLAALLFVVLTWLIGRSVMPRPSASQKELWMFTTVFALLVAFIVSFLGPYVPGLVIPSDLTVLPPILLSFLLVVFGAAMFVTGWELKWGVTQMTGLIWLVGAVTWVLNAGPNAYFHFALLAGLPFVVYGLLMKG